MRKFVLFGLLAALSVGCLAQSPFAAEYIDMWKVVQSIRSTYKITTIAGIGNENLGALDVFLDARQMDNLWNAVNGLGGSRITTLAALAKVKYLGPAAYATILVFHSFTDEGELAPVLIGKVKK